MIIMGRSKSGSMANAIVKKLGKPDSDYESLKRENESKYEPKEDSSTEKDFKSGLDAAANKMLEAMESKDVPSLKEALRSFIEMAMQDR